jgi:hypothetical protein
VFEALSSFSPQAADPRISLDAFRERLGTSATHAAVMVARVYKHVPLRPPLSQILARRSEQQATASGCGTGM